MRDLVRAEAKGTVTIRDASIVPACYHDCAPEHIAVMLRRAQAIEAKDLSTLRLRI